MKDLMKSWLFRVILIPAGVFLSVMFGGGASSGREIAAYMSSNGPVGGLLAIFLIALMYSAVVFLCYELGRMFRTWEYQSFSKVILGQKAWILYEITITFSMFLVLAYAATAGGTALSDHFGLPRYASTGALLAIVVFLNYQGRRLVEMSQVGTAAVLLLCTLAMVIGAFHSFGDVISYRMNDTAIDFKSLINNVWTYSVVVMSYVPIILYAARDLRTRGETLAAGLASGFTIMLPPLGMHISYLSHYPEILSKDVPNAWIVEEVMPAWFSDLFVLVLFVVILQTGVGLLQGFLERLDAWAIAKRDKPLSKKSHGGISALALVSCLGLSSLGVVELLYRIYAITYWLFLPIFIIPLFTIGVYRIFFQPRKS